jgi:hypothetical protein
MANICHREFQLPCAAVLWAVHAELVGHASGPRVGEHEDACWVRHHDEADAAIRRGDLGQGILKAEPRCSVPWLLLGTESGKRGEHVVLPSS